MNNIKSIFVAILAFSFAFIAGACDDTSKKESGSAQFKFGTVEIPQLTGALCGATFYIAKEKGFFAEEGIDAKFIAADSETRKLGLSKGTYPVASGDFQFFQAIENGVDIKIADGVHVGCVKIIVKKGSPIKAAADLKGKKIAVDEIGGTPHQVAALWLSLEGISAKPEDGQVTFLPYSDGNLSVEALKQGQVDAIAIWDPLGSAKVKAGEAEVLLNIASDHVFNGRYCCFLYISAKVYKENPAKIAALLRALHKADAWISEHPEETVDIIVEGKYSDIADRDLAIDLIKEYSFVSKEKQKELGRNAKADIRFFAEQLNKIGYLNKEAEQFTNDLFVDVDLNQ